MASLLVRLALGAALIAMLVWTVTAGPVRRLGPSIHGAQPPDAGTSTATAVDSADATPATWVLPAMIGLAVIAVAVGMLVVRSRCRARRHRAFARFWILPSRVDEAPPEAVTALLKAWHEQLGERWWRRLTRGQPGLTLEAHCTTGPQGMRVRLVVGCPRQLAQALAGPLNACYSDARLVPADDLPPEATQALLRLRKRDRFVRRLAAAPDHGAPPMDTLLATLGALAVPAVVQFALTPAPTPLELAARGLLRAREHQLGHSKIRSRAGELELSGGEATQWTGLWFAELRVGAPSWEAGHRIAGALAGASAENRLRERRVLAGKDRTRDRLRRGLGATLPGAITDVLSCAEVAALFHLPSPALRTVGFERSSVPRAIAPPQVLRPADRTRALGRDDIGFVGLHPGDLEKNLALFGQIGSGKTSVLAKTTERDAHDEGACVIVIDPNSTGVAAHLSAIPEHRVVHHLDIAHPELGFNPLLASGPISKVADDLVEAFVDVHDSGEIMTSSRQFLGGAAEAVIGAHRHGALGHPPSLWDLYRVLLPSETAFRSKLLDAIASDRELLGAATLLGQDIPQGLREIGGQYALRMNAPRNKLTQLRSRNIDRVLRHPRQLDVGALIAGREVLVVDGRMGSTGVAQTRVLVMLLLNLVFAELRRQLERPPHERVRVCLKLDEAHLVMGEHFATALATLRAAGLEVTACYQYSAQLTEPVVRAGAGSLLASRCVFQLSEPEDAEQAAKLAMSAYSTSVRPDAESRARTGITPDVIMHLPRHWAICSWQAGGARVPAFAMNTLPLAIDDVRIAHHTALQRARGGFVPDVLPHPLAPAGNGPTAHPLPEPEPTATRAPAPDEDEAFAGLDALVRSNGTPTPRAPQPAPTPSAPPARTTRRRPRSAPAAEPSTTAVGATALASAPTASIELGAEMSAAAATPRSTLVPETSSSPSQDNSAPASPVPTAAAAGIRSRGPAAADEQSAATSTAATDTPPAETARAQLERVQAEVLEQARREAAATTDTAPLTESEAAGTAPSPVPATSNTTAPGTAVSATTGKPTRRPAKPRSRAATPTLPPVQSPVPDTYLEVQLEPTSLVWDDRPVDPIDKARKPDARQLEALGALHRLGPLLSSQLEREFYPHTSERTVQRSLTAMRKAGWVRRFRLHDPNVAGQAKYVYVLDRRGFDLARDVAGPRGPYIRDGSAFVERRFESVLKPVHDLHANGLLFALMHQMPHAARSWRGAGESVIVPPRRRPRGEPERPIRTDEITLDAPLRITGLQIDRFEQIKPDFTIEVAITGSDNRRRRFDLLVELDRSGNPRSDSNTRKLLRYDALLVAWHTLVERYRTLGHSPIVVVACADEPTARRWATTADELLTGRVGRLGDPDAEAAFHARKRMFFATELDLHCGRLRGYRVPSHPPELRRRLDTGRAPALEQLTFLPDRYVR